MDTESHPVPLSKEPLARLENTRMCKTILYSCKSSLPRGQTIKHGTCYKWDLGETGKETDPDSMGGIREGPGKRSTVFQRLTRESVVTPATEETQAG